MKKLVIALVLGLFAGLALAVDYNVSLSWTDPTPPGAGYTPQYDLQHRVNGGPETTVEDLASPAWAGVVSANESDTIEVRVRAENAQGPIPGNYTTWITSSAPICSVTPLDQTTVVVTITCP